MLSNERKQIKIFLFFYVKTRSVHYTQTLFLRAAKRKYQLQILKNITTPNMLKVASPHCPVPPHSPRCRPPGAAAVQRCYRRDAGRAEGLLCHPSGDTATAQPKGGYFTAERSEMRNGFQSHRPLVFAKQIESPCLAAEQRV